MKDSRVIKKVGEECASKVLWEVAKTMGKAGLAAGVFGAGAGSMSIAIPFFAGYIGLTAWRGWKGLKGDEARARELERVWEAASGTEGQLREFIEESYKDSFEAERDREQMLRRIKRLQEGVRFVEGGSGSDYGGSGGAGRGARGDTAGGGADGGIGGGVWGMCGGEVCGI